MSFYIKSKKTGELSESTRKSQEVTLLCPRCAMRTVRNKSDVCYVCEAREKKAIDRYCEHCHALIDRGRFCLDHKFKKDRTAASRGQ
jgi:hypothetical protein